MVDLDTARRPIQYYASYYPWIEDSSENCSAGEFAALILKNATAFAEWNARG